MSFLVVQLGSDKSFFYPNTKAFGSVDVRTDKCDSPLEILAIKKSISAFSISINETIAPRFVTVIDTNDEQSAQIEAKARFDECLNFLFMNWKGLEDYSITPAGFIKNLKTGKILPILPTSALGKVPVFMVAGEKFPPIELSQWISYTGDKNEISGIITRSLHWRRLSSLENGPEVKFLFNWISLETMLKTHEDDDVIPKAMLCLGFITSRYGRDLSKSFVTKMQSYPDYKKWKDWAELKISAMRDYRNNVVHSGFRSIEISRFELNAYNKILSLAVPRAIGLLHHAQIEGIDDIKIAWEFAGPLIELSGDGKVTDFHGTVLHTLNS